MFMILEMNEDKAPPPAVGDVYTADVCQLQFSEAASLAMFIDQTEIHFDIYITAQKSQWKRTGQQSWWATWKTGAVSSVGTSQASLTRASRSPFEGTLKDINFVFEYRVDLRPWIAEDHRLIAKYDGKVSVKKETVKVEMIKEGSGWVLQLDSELEPIELGD